MLIALYSNDECSHHYFYLLIQLINLANIHSNHFLPGLHIGAVEHPFRTTRHSQWRPLNSPVSYFSSAARV